MAFTSAWAVMSVVSTTVLCEHDSNFAAAGDRTAERTLAGGDALAALLDRQPH